MCGISGVVNLGNREPISQEELYRANQTMLHRGPDDRGIYCEPNVGLAARRLSIIDLSDGKQPVASEDNTVHIVYNGEMYMQCALRGELQALGHRFRTRVDTEVVLKAYLEWGLEGCIERLRGMYAFAIWDSRIQALYLVRDRMGIKPLYYAEHRGRLYFASEIRGMLLHSRMPRTANLAALEAFMEVGFVPGRITVFEGILKLLPGHYIVAKNGRLSEHQYWQLTYEDPPMHSETEYVEKFHDLLRESVRISLMSDVPLGALLSGGVDSTTLAALMQEESGRSIKTVSIGFEIGSNDETEFILDNASALNTDHRHTSFTSHALDEFPKAMFYLEEPLSDPVFTVFYMLYKACRRENLKVVLNGEGADELLAGYFWHRGETWARPFLALPYPLRALVAHSPLVRTRGGAGRRFGEILRTAAPDVDTRYRAWLRLGAPGLGRAVLSDEIVSELSTNGQQKILDDWAGYASMGSQGSEMNRMLWIQSRTRMVDRSNHMVDRMSMAHSVEARVPFQDHMLWEFCARMPTRLKIGGSYIRPIEKYILRQATRNLIHEDTRNRRKKGLTAPYRAWLSSSRCPEWAQSLLSEAQLKKAGLFNVDAVQAIRKEVHAGVPDRETLLMGILAIQTWSYLFLESPITATEPVV
ncbi:asparagine synthase (glutamine-hydrolyzing) [Pseudomonadota bacterium]